MTTRQCTREHLDPGARDARVAQIERFQVRQHFQAFEPGIRDLAAIEIQLFELLHAAEGFESGISCV